ncbi:MAG: ABC transporter permease, partial [Acidimicrobiales bacterium]
MKWRDAVGLAVTGVRRRLGRAVLTVMAVALAATLLTALLTIAGTARTRVLGQLAKGGPLAGIKVAAAEPRPDQVDEDNARAGPRRDLDAAAVRRIAALPDVRTVIPVITVPVAALGPDGKRPFFDTLVGVDLRHVADLPITVTAGRLPLVASPTEVAVTEGYLKRQGIADEQAASVLGSEVELGSPRVLHLGGQRQIRGRWSRVQIVGVVAQEAAPGQFLMAREGVGPARAWAAGSEADRSFNVPTSPFAGLFVVARGIDKVGSTRASITEIGYATSAPENLLAAVSRYLRVVEIVLGAIGLIALAIAALGIANALFAAVRERRREIGVLKAIGARDRDVRRVFVLEAAALGFFGGVLGSVAGSGLALGVAGVVNGYLGDQGLTGVAVVVPLPVIVGGVLGSTLL